MGGRWVDGPDFKDQGQTPNMQLTVMDFGGPLLVFEVRGLVEKKGKKGEFSSQVTNEFYLEEGAIKGGKFYPKGKTQGEPLVQTKSKKKRGESHFANFIRAVRSRNQGELNADILQGHLSAACCHLGNISYRLGGKVPFGQEYQTLGDCEQVQESVKAIEDNLAARWAWTLQRPPTRWARNSNSTPRPRSLSATRKPTPY